MVTRNTNSVENPNCSQFALADQLEQRLAQARGQLAKLTPSLLARAFVGKLIPQNPADEPAEKLLERIRTGGKS